MVPTFFKISSRHCCTVVCPVTHPLAVTPAIGAKKYDRLSGKSRFQFLVHRLKYKTLSKETLLYDTNGISLHRRSIKKSILLCSRVDFPIIIFAFSTVYLTGRFKCLLQGFTICCQKAHSKPELLTVEKGLRAAQLFQNSWV